MRTQQAFPAHLRRKLMDEENRNALDDDPSESASTPKQRIVRGMPIDPDVKKLLERWPEENFEVGMIVTSDDVAETMGNEKDSHRFRSVVAHWKAYLQKRGVRLAAVTRVGYIRIGAQRIIDNSHATLKKTNRILSSQILDLSLAKAENKHQQVLIDHHRMVLRKIRAHSTEVVDRLTISTVPQCQPRTRPEMFLGPKPVIVETEEETA